MRTLSTPLRTVARDGALLAFDPATGVNVLVRSPATRALRARAPRVAMFAPTNACNLRCAFCSRDPAAPSRWTVESAFDLLAGLAAHGVLEVALGGGEPLAFRGLDELLARLRAETPLAVHVTTNAVLLDDARLARLRPLVGEFRVSIYDDTPWPARIAALAAAGGSFGANVLVTPERISSLAPLLARLEDLGCPDVALLRYVGPDRARTLSPHDLDRVARAARRTSMRVRASVCFGDALPLPRLATSDASDCGAGGDFLVVGSDRTVRACSFSSDAIPIETAADAIAVWRRERERLARRVELLGCARSRDRGRAGTHAPEPDGVRVWQAFSANNSGECYLVGEFERAADAESFVARVKAALDAPGGAPSEAWRGLVRPAGIELGAHETMPETIDVLGRKVIAHLGFDSGDAFPSLRALLWSEGGLEVARGIHVHEPVHVLAAIRPEDPRRIDALEERALATELDQIARRGDVLFATHRAGTVSESIEIVRSLAGDACTASAELIACETAPVPLARLLAAPAPADERAWLAVGFHPPDGAERFAAPFGERGAAGAGLALIRADRLRPREVLRAYREGGSPRILRADVVHLSLAVWREPRKGRDAEEIDLDVLERELRAALGADGALTGPATRDWNVHVRVATARPLVVLPLLARFAESRGLRAWIGIAEPLAVEHAIARLDVDVRALRRVRS